MSYQGPGTYIYDPQTKKTMRLGWPVPEENKQKSAISRKKVVFLILSIIFGTIGLVCGLKLNRRDIVMCGKVQEKADLTRFNKGQEHEHLVLITKFEDGMQAIEVSRLVFLKSPIGAQVCFTRSIAESQDWHPYRTATLISIVAGITFLALWAFAPQDQPR